MDKNDIQFTDLHNELKSKDAIPVGKKLENNDPDDNDFKNRNKKYTELIGNYSSSFKTRHIIKALETKKASIMTHYGVKESVGADIAIRTVKELAKQYGVEVE
jgi:hypothetical protein